MRLVAVVILVALSAAHAYAGQDCEAIKEKILSCRTDVRVSGCRAEPPLREQYRKCMSDAAVDEASERERREAERDEQRRQGEQERCRQAADEHAQQETAEAAHAARENAVKSDRKQMGIVFGGAFCYAKTIRLSATSEIAKERKYASEGGGIVDKAKLYQLQQRLRWADEAVALFAKKLHLWHGLAPAPCTDHQVSRLVACKLSDGESCPGEIGTYAEFIGSAPGVDE